MSTTDRREPEALPVPVPDVTPETAAFWDATAQGTLLLPRCNRCDSVIWYPRTFCSVCASLDVTWFAATGRGTVYSFTVIRRPAPPYDRSAPFVVAYVELAEGPRILTNIVECAPDEVEIGMDVEVVFHDTGEGRALYRFRPVHS
jgi:uncharacterized OB-fold protein